MVAGWSILVEGWSLKVRMRDVGFPFVCADWDNVSFLTIEKDVVALSVRLPSLKLD